MAITFPHIFQDGTNEIASGVAVMENLNVLKAAVEEIQAGTLGAFHAIRTGLSQPLEFKSIAIASFIGSPTPFFGVGPQLEWANSCVASWVGSPIGFDAANASPANDPTFAVTGIVVNGTTGSKSGNGAAYAFQSASGGFYFRSTLYGLGY